MSFVNVCLFYLFLVLWSVNNLLQVPVLSNEYMFAICSSCSSEICILDKLILSHKQLKDIRQVDLTAFAYQFLHDKTKRGDEPVLLCLEYPSKNEDYLASFSFYLIKYPVPFSLWGGFFVVLKAIHCATPLILSFSGPLPCLGNIWPYYQVGSCYQIINIWNSFTINFQDIYGQRLKVMC